MARPQNIVHAEQPPPLQHDFDILDEQSRRSKCVFRVWDDASASPLMWTQFKSDSGFAAPNGNLSRLSANAYLAHFRANRGQVMWAEGPYLKQTVVDHILGKWRQTCTNVVGMVADEEGTPIPEDDKSPWISTSKDLTWCIWEIARRLARRVGEIDREYADTREADPSGRAAARREARAGAVVNLAIIRHHSGTIALKDARSGHLESHIDPKGPAGRKAPGMSVSIQGDYDDARRLATASSEVLYYGRVFAENIDSNLECTVERLPFDLPEYFFRPPRQTSRRPSSPGSEEDEDGDAGGLRGWLAELVWDPRSDDIGTARDLLRRRRVELGRGMRSQIESSTGGWGGRQGWPDHRGQLDERDEVLHHLSVEGIGTSGSSMRSYGGHARHESVRRGRGHRRRGVGKS